MAEQERQVSVLSLQLQTYTTYEQMINHLIYEQLHQQHLAKHQQEPKIEQMQWFLGMSIHLLAGERIT